MGSSDDDHRADFHTFPPPFTEDGFHEDMDLRTIDLGCGRVLPRPMTDEELEEISCKAEFDAMHAITEANRLAAEVSGDPTSAGTACGRFYQRMPH